MLLQKGLRAKPAASHSFI